MSVFASLPLGWTTIHVAPASASEIDAVYEKDIQPLLNRHCFRCHGNDDANADVNLQVMADGGARQSAFEMWESVASVVEDGLMPPEDEQQLSDSERDAILAWYRKEFIDSVTAKPGDFRPRRLSAHEYRNTLHSVFGFSLDVAIIEAEQTVTEKSLVIKLLPEDPPGASGFKNDTSGNPLTPYVWDQYSYLIDFGLEQLMSANDGHHLAKILGRPITMPLNYTDSEALVRVIARRAYRRPVDDEVIEASLTAVREADETELPSVVRTELKTILMSPRFFYRGLMLDAPEDREVPVDDYEFAERLSYFLWASGPDESLIRAASEGSLGSVTQVAAQVDRMLSDSQSRNLATHLGGEWFSLSEIEHVSNNPPVTDALKSQPVDFLHYLFTENRPILELIDSDVAFVNQHTAKFYPGDRKQLISVPRQKGVEVASVPNQRIRLKESRYRGGLLTTPGVLAMNRGPVLRGTWLLERVLGEHLPEPPANVGQVPANKRGEDLTFRERFAMHRANPTCAVCHDKIDPLGFSLQWYDDSGVNLKHEKPKVKKGKTSKVNVARIDSSGRLPSGEAFDDFGELKQILVSSQKRQVVENTVRRFLAYAICRKLEYFDRPTVDGITDRLVENDGTFRDLVLEICSSLPMRQTVVRSR